MITAGMPCSLPTCCQYSRAVPFAVMVSLHGMKCAIFVALSTTVIMAFIPWSSGIPMTKSIATCSHLRVGDVFGPSAPRTCHRTLTLSQPPHRRGCPLHSPMRTPACCQPFGSGTVQRHAAVACRLFFASRRAWERWLSSEVRGRRMARRSDEYSARSRCYSTQSHSTKTEESKITQMQKGTIIKGRPSFCHHQCSRTAARPRAALPRCNVQSTTHVPMA